MLLSILIIYHCAVTESSKHQISITHWNVHSECRTSHFTTPNFRPAGLKFMVEYTARTPNTWVLSGGAAASRDWLDSGWDVSEKLVYQTGFIYPSAPLQYKNMAKIWLYKYTYKLEPHIGHQKYDKYYSVFAPGTLGDITRHLSGPS